MERAERRRSSDDDPASDSSSDESPLSQRTDSKEKKKKKKKVKDSKSKDPDKKKKKKSSKKRSEQSAGEEPDVWDRPKGPSLLDDDEQNEEWGVMRGSVLASDAPDDADDFAQIVRPRHQAGEFAADFDRVDFSANQPSFQQPTKPPNVPSVDAGFHDFDPKSLTRKLSQQSNHSQQQFGGNNRGADGVRQLMTLKRGDVDEQNGFGWVVDETLRGQKIGTYNSRRNSDSSGGQGMSTDAEEDDDDEINYDDTRSRTSRSRVSVHQPYNSGYSGDYSSQHGDNDIDFDDSRSRNSRSRVSVQQPYSGGFSGDYSSQYSHDESRGGVPRGGVYQDNVSRGDISRGNVSRGDRSRGDVPRGDGSLGDHSQGNASRGNYSRGNMSQGNMSQGNRSQGNRSNGAESWGGKKHPPSQDPGSYRGGHPGANPNPRWRPRQEVQSNDVIVFGPGQHNDAYFDGVTPNRVGDIIGEEYNDDDRSVSSDLTGMTGAFSVMIDFDNSFRDDEDDGLPEVAALAYPKYDKAASARIAAQRQQRQHEHGPRAVRFGGVEIRHYERILGDNPSCTAGASLSIGWRYKLQRGLNLDDLEASKGPHKKANELVLDRHQRETILLEIGYSKKEIAEATRLIVRDKNKRKQTVTNLGHSNVEESMEYAAKNVKRLFGFGSR